MAVDWGLDTTVEVHGLAGKVCDREVRLEKVKARVVNGWILWILNGWNDPVWLDCDMDEELVSRFGDGLVEDCDWLVSKGATVLI